MRVGKQFFAGFGCRGLDGQPAAVGLSAAMGAAIQRGRFRVGLGDGDFVKLNPQGLGCNLGQNGPVALALIGGRRDQVDAAVRVDHHRCRSRIGQGLARACTVQHGGKADSPPAGALIPEPETL